MAKFKEASSKLIQAFYADHLPEYWKSVEENHYVWQDRYHDFNVYSDKKIEEKLVYMHNNPVKAELVKEATDWMYSSARFWLLGKPVGIPISNFP